MNKLKLLPFLLLTWVLIPMASSNESDRISFQSIEFLAIDSIEYQLKDTLESKGQLKLDHILSSHFRICYSVDSLLPSEQIKYKIDGFDRMWINDTGCQCIASTNLLGGKYLVKVGIFKGDQQIEETSFELIVLPPWWKTWMFRGIVMLFIGGLFLFVGIKAIGKKKPKVRS